MPKETKDRAQRRREQREVVRANGRLTVTNGAIWNAKDSLRNLLLKEWPVRSSFHLAKLASTLNGHLQNIHSVREELIKKHGTPIEGRRGVFEVTDASPNVEVYQKELKELMDIEVEVAVSLISLPAVVDGKEILVVAADLFNLTPFIDIEGAGQQEAK